MKGWIKNIDLKECNDCGETIDITDDMCSKCGGNSFTSLYNCDICGATYTRGDGRKEHYKDHFKGYKP